MEGVCWESKAPFYEYETLNQGGEVNLMQTTLGVGGAIIKKPLFDKRTIAELFNENDTDCRFKNPPFTNTQTPSSASENREKCA